MHMPMAAGARPRRRPARRSAPRRDARQGSLLPPTPGQRASADASARPTVPPPTIDRPPAAPPLLRPPLPFRPGAGAPLRARARADCGRPAAPPRCVCHERAQVELVCRGGEVPSMLVCAFFVPATPSLAPRPLPRRRRCALPSPRACRTTDGIAAPAHLAVGAPAGPATNQILDGRPPSLRCNAAARPDELRPAPTALPVKSNQPSFIIHPPPVGRPTRAPPAAPPNSPALVARRAPRQPLTRQQAPARRGGQGRARPREDTHHRERPRPRLPPPSGLRRRERVLRSPPSRGRARPTPPAPSRRPTLGKFMCAAARSTPARRARRAAAPHLTPPRLARGKKLGPQKPDWPPLQQPKVRWGAAPGMPSTWRAPPLTRRAPRSQEFTGRASRCVERRWRAHDCHERLHRAAAISVHWLTHARARCCASHTRWPS